MIDLQERSLCSPHPPHPHPLQVQQQVAATKSELQMAALRWQGCQSVAQEGAAMAQSLRGQVQALSEQLRAEQQQVGKLHWLLRKHIPCQAQVACALGCSGLA